MKNKLKDIVPLSSDEASELVVLFKEHAAVISHVLMYNLGTFYAYLYDECVSEVYLVACQNMHKLKKHENPGGWLVSVARRTALRIIKEHSKDLRTLPLDESIRLTAEPDHVEEILYKTWIEDGVPQKLIGILTPREKQVYKLVYINKKTVNQTAAELNISPNTVWGMRRSLRKKIQKAIEEKNF